MVLDLGPHNPNDTENMIRTRREKWEDVITDSLITAGISGVTTYLAEPRISAEVALATFLLAFLIKLKDLRSK